jgi:hypothetical protein
LNLFLNSSGGKTAAAAIAAGLFAADDCLISDNATRQAPQFDARSHPGAHC